MNVKEAIVAAKDYVKEVYADEQVADLGLEETDYDDTQGNWLITLGFSRPWTTPRSTTRLLLDQMGATDRAAPSRKRVYKLVTIDREGKVVSMKNRETADADG